MQGHIVWAQISVDASDTIIDKAIAFASRSLRQDGKYQTPVCDVCDRFIIGVEYIHSLSKQRILENQHRLSVKMYEEFYGGEKMSSILANQ